MSSSIAIPKRKQPRHSSGSYASSSSMACSSSSSSAVASPSSSSTASMSPKTPSAYVMASSSKAIMPSSSVPRHSDRRPSLLGTSISKSEHTVINVGGPDGPPRLITCVKASQGFDWNQDIFLPSYMDYDSSELERKADPVQDIVLSDEEAAGFFPQ